MNLLQTWALVMVVSSPATESPKTDDAMFKECQKVAAFLQNSYLPLLKQSDPQVKVQILCTNRK